MNDRILKKKYDVMERSKENDEFPDMEDEYGSSDFTSNTITDSQCEKIKSLLKKMDSNQLNKAYYAIMEYPSSVTLILFDEDLDKFLSLFGMTMDEVEACCVDGETDVSRVIVNTFWGALDQFTPFSIVENELHGKSPIEIFNKSSHLNAVCLSNKYDGEYYPLLCEANSLDELEAQYFIKDLESILEEK